MLVLLRKRQGNSDMMWGLTAAGPRSRSTSTASALPALCGLAAVAREETCRLDYLFLCIPNGPTDG